MDSRRFKPLLTIQPQTQEYLQYIGKSFAQAASTFIMHACSLKLYATCTVPFCTYLPPNLYFSFPLGITAVPRELENNAYAKFGRQIQCIMGDVQVAYSLFSNPHNTLCLPPTTLPRTKFCIKFENNILCFRLKRVNLKTH